MKTMKLKGLIARILGDHPTSNQETVFWFMLLLLLFWPIGAFVSMFFFDAPIQSFIDGACRTGAALTIWLYPLYLFPLMRLWFQFSKHLKAAWLFYFCPLIPVAIFFLFATVASRASFRDISEDYATDKNHLWYNEVDPLYVADMGSFKRIGNYWAIDKKNVYYMGIEAEVGKNTVPIGDYHTFRTLNDSYAADAKYVYYQNKIVEGADPETFVPLKGEPHYGQDKNRVYCKARGSSIRSLNQLKHKNMKDGLRNAFHTDGKTVYNPELMAMPEGTDFATIHKVERYRDWYADSKHVYYENRLLPGANPQTFKVFPSHYVSEGHVTDNNKDIDYSHDGNHVYYRDSLMQDADISSFICGYDFVDSTGFAFDKNRYYEGSPNPRLEQLRRNK